MRVFTELIVTGDPHAWLNLPCTGTPGRDEETTMPGEQKDGMMDCNAQFEMDCNAQFEEVNLLYGDS